MEELDPGWRSPTLGEIDPAGHGRAQALSPPAMGELDPDPTMGKLDPVGHMGSSAPPAMEGPDFRRRGRQMGGGRRGRRMGGGRRGRRPWRSARWMGKTGPCTWGRSRARGEEGSRSSPIPSNTEGGGSVLCATERRCSQYTLALLMISNYNT